MYEGKVSALFLRFAVPQMLGLLFNSIYTIVDGVFIGNRLGREAMAAAAVAVPMLEILISMAIAVSSGAGVFISIRLSQHEKESAQRFFQEAIWILGIAGFLIATLGNLWLEPLAKLLGATPEILDDAATYLRYIVTFAPFQLLSFLLGGMARNDGCPKLAMTALMLGAVSNIVLDYVFMYPLDMGIGGAALATALGPIFSVTILLPHFLLKRGDLYFQRCRSSARDIHYILLYGFPSFIMEFSIGLITFLYNFVIVHYGYGEKGLAAYLVIGYLMLIILTLFLGLAEGLQPVFSYLFGAGDTKKIQDMRRFAASIFLVLGLLCYGMIILAAGTFYRIFTPGDLELVSFAYEKSRSYFCGFFLAGFNILMISFWQSTEAPEKALLISLLRSLILPPIFMTLLPFLFGKEVMWACLSVVEAVTACCVLLYSRIAQHTVP